MQTEIRSQKIRQRLKYQQLIVTSLSSCLFRKKHLWIINEAKRTFRNPFRFLLHYIFNSACWLIPRHNSFILECVSCLFSCLTWNNMSYPFHFYSIVDAPAVYVYAFSEYRIKEKSSRIVTFMALAEILTCLEEWRWWMDVCFVRVHVESMFENCGELLSSRSSQWRTA